MSRYSYNYLEYKKAEDELDLHRRAGDDINKFTKRSLGGIPFFSVDIRDLFNTDNFPCVALHPYFVLKIVDELIYCGLQQKET